MRFPATALDVIQRPLPWSDFNAQAPTNRRPASPVDLPAISEDEVARLDEGYRSSGGLVMASDALSMLRCVSDQPLSLLARWIVDRQVIHFVWRAQTFMPLGQFDMHTMQVRETWCKAMRCLPTEMDEWDAAWWFAEPNAMLDGSAPADALRDNAERVEQVARLAVPVRSR